MTFDPYTPPKANLAEQSRASVPPQRVRISVALLWFAWALSAALLVFNRILLQDRVGASLGTLIGVGGLVVQGVAIYFIRRGSNVARIIAVVFLLLATPGLYIILQFISTLSPLSAASTIVGYLVKLIAISLLFSGEARSWFRPSHVRSSGT